MKKVTLRLNGMHCTSCSVLIDTVLEELPGIKSAKSNFIDQKVEVEYDPLQVDIHKMVSVIKSEGYDASD